MHDELNLFYTGTVKHRANLEINLKGNKAADI